MNYQYKNVVVEVSLNPKMLERLKCLNHSPIIQNAETVHFIHVCNKAEEEYLSEEMKCSSDFEKVESHVLEIIENLKNSVLEDPAKRRNSKCCCLFNKNTKLKSLEYLEEVNADLAIAVTRGNQGVEGLFSDSFSFWLVENAPCDVYIIRP